jgi:DNA-directed RNA polymerase specialized sigma24 family protein
MTGPLGFKSLVHHPSIAGPVQTESTAPYLALPGLADALETLPAHYREVFILRNLEHIPFDQIAARMGRSPGATRVLWKRAMDRLSQLLRDQP